MRDAMTPETIRAALHELAQMEFVGRMLDREYHAALTHARAALDAVARVRTLAPLLYAERVRLIADEYAGVLSTGAVVTLHDVATRLADIGRALDGEADR